MRAPRLPRETVTLTFSGVGLLVAVMLVGVSALLFFAWQIIRGLFWWAIT